MPIADALAADFRTALRSCRASSGTTAAAILTLALAAGLNLAMYGLIDRAMFAPPAHVADSDRVFAVSFEAPGSQGTPGWMTTASYVAFEAIAGAQPGGGVAAAFQPGQANASRAGSLLTVDAMLVSGSYFPLLGARPLIGRGIGPEDDAPPAGNPVAVLSHAFWRRTFGADPAVLGRQVTLRGVEFTVAGVMPPGFSGHSSARVDVWVPFHAAMRDSQGWAHDPFRNITGVVIRLAPGAAPEVAAEQASAAIDRRVQLTPIRGAVVAGWERRIAYWLAGVSVLVLVIGAANAATLLLVRGSRRRRDFAIRTALGASRARLVSQVAIEAALVAATAVAGALLLAGWLDEAIRRVLLPSVAESGGGGLRTLGAAAAAGVLAFAAAAMAGMLQLPERHRSGGRGLTSDALAGSVPAVSRAARPARLLLVLQTALSVLLLAGAGLFGRSLFNLMSQDLGMQMDDVLLVRFDEGSQAIRDRDGLFLRGVERVRALPEVQAATTIQMVPFTGFHVLPVSVPGRAEPPRANGQLPYLFAATPELLDILRIKVVEGRGFVPADDRGAPVILVNRALAAAAWPGESAIGKCLKIGFDPSFDPFVDEGPPPPPTNVPCRQVIGVVNDVRQRSLVPTGAEARLMQYYVPFSQVPTAAGGGSGPGIQGLLVRTSGTAAALGPSIRRIVTDGRTDLPFLQVRPYADLLERQVRPWRQGTALLAFFGGLALVVAAVGLYAAFSHAVDARRRELAIRLAIGARPPAVLRMILREAAVLAAIGAACGAALTVAASRGLASMLFDVAAWDPLVLVSAAALMITIAALATLLPARNASRTDPSALLRAE